LIFVMVGRSRASLDSRLPMKRVAKKNLFQIGVAEQKSLRIPGLEKAESDFERG